MAYFGKNSSLAAKRASTAERVAGGAHQALDRLTEAARPTVARVTSTAHQVVDRIGDTTNRVAQGLGRTATRLKDAEQQWVGTSSGYIREHPFKATGIALAAGFLISQLLSWYRAGRTESAEDDVTTTTRQR